MSYRIIITRIETGIELSTDWKKITDDPESTKQYGYITADIPVTRKIDIYEQEVQNLNLIKVIQAINGLL